MAIKITARAKAFSSEPMQEYRMLADIATQTVSVWDSVAQHYTTCHSLRPASLKRILRLAAETSASASTMGSARSAAKTEAARANGAKGGRPKKS